jgi:molybdopterin molybdotransferase
MRNEMISVAEAEQIIQSQTRSYGTESVPLESSLGRVLAENLMADRDLPPFNRVTMDGIAIQFGTFEKGIRSFKIKATQAAGETPVNISAENECIEIMTGAALPETADTIIRYEDVELKNGLATVKVASITKGQNVHFQGEDKKMNGIIASAPQVISPALIGIAASIGKEMLCVKKPPCAIIISTGDELVEINEVPAPYQIRRSNSYTIKAVLQQYGLHSDMIHLPDDAEITRQQISRCLEDYDVILLSGGVSMGKFDYVPQALQELSVQKYFHKVQQRPGKPFWFGAHSGGTLVFAFPGNPVSAFMCLHRYFVPWLQSSLQILTSPTYAVLDQDVNFDSQLQYFMQVKIRNENGKLFATPVDGKGSGDFANLLEADAFMELPAEKSTFRKGETYKVWRCKS